MTVHCSPALLWGTSCLSLLGECSFRFAHSEVCVRCTRGDQACALGVQGGWRGNADQKTSASETGLGHLYPQESGQFVCVCVCECVYVFSRGWGWVFF